VPTDSERDQARRRRAGRAKSGTSRDNARCPGDSSTPASPGHAVTGLVQPRDTYALTCVNANEWVPLGHPGVEWLRAPGYSRYEASRHSLWTRGEDGKPVLVCGGIRNAAGLLMRPRVNRDGYLLINLVDDTGVKRTLCVHKVILLAHAGEPGPGEEALHEDDNPFDNRFPLKLYYGTHARNEAQKVANGGRRPAPVRNPNRPPKPRELARTERGSRFAWLRRLRRKTR
jgi:hypothetical protein